MGLFGPPNVSKLEDKRDVQALIEALGYRKDYEVRCEAAMALGRLRDPRAVEPLIAALWDCSDVAVAAAKALGRLSDPRAVEPLIRAVNASGVLGATLTRQAAADALGQFRDPRAVEALVGVLGDRDLQGRAIAALEKTGSVPQSGEAAALYWIAKGDFMKCAQVGSPAVEPLIAALRGPKSREAAGALGQVGDPRAVEPLIAALRSGDEDVRKAAAQALGRIGDPRSIEALIAVIVHGPWTVQDTAAEALRQIPGPGAVEPLVASLRASDPGPRQVVVGVLEKMGAVPESGEGAALYWIAKREFMRCAQLGAAAVDPLIAVLKGDWPIDRGVAAHSGTPDARAEAAAALGAVGDRRAVEPLIAALKEGPSMRQAAVAALERIGAVPESGEGAALYWIAKGDVTRCVQLGAAAVEPLIGALALYLDRGGRTTAIQALGEIGDPRAVDTLVYAVTTSLGPRETAAIALARIGKPAVEPLLAKLKGSVWHVRKAAAEALVFLYKEGSLDQASRGAILRRRAEIVESHDDRHGDIPSSPNPGWHTDEGIGLEFPL